MKMTEKEQKMLEIAEQVIEMNQDIKAALTGSLLLSFMGVEKREEAKDIDIIVDCLCEQPDQEGFPIVPFGFKLVDLDGRKSSVDSMLFENKEGIILNVLFSEEEKQTINGLMCGDLKLMLECKLHYSRNDKSEESRNKHVLDLEYLKENNPELKNIIDLFDTNITEDKIY